MRARAENTVADAALEDYRSMLTIRRFEEKVLALRMAEQIVGSVHLCIGQEAIPVGTCASRQPTDPVFATYRGHGWALACGSDLESLFCELLGRRGGTNQGRAGSAYLTDASVHFMGENSIVGAGAPIAVGAALASSIDGTNEVAICALGDGAMNQGAVHEALNLASAMRLPVVFVCENNRYSELTPIDDMVGEPRLWRRAAGYGMVGVRIDGNDPAAVRRAAGEALRRARHGGGPTLMEAMTQRLCGHYIGDAETYRSAGEVQRAAEDEPIVRLRDALATDYAADLAAIERAVTGQIGAAAAAALAAPLADPSTARCHVHA